MTKLTDNRALATRAMRAAARMRNAARADRSNPVCVFDLAERLGIEVRFVDAPSLEGMYRQDSRGTVLIPSSAHRPLGRIAFSCAHEIGHHAFGHGTRVDEYIEDSARTRTFDPDEWIANAFAGYLLMPRSAMDDAFRRRQISPSEADALRLFAIASEFGVGYDTLLSHLRWSLRLISGDRAESLGRTTPKQIRSQLLGHANHKRIVLVDSAWKSSAVAIDLEVGDAAILPFDVLIEGQAIRQVDHSTRGPVVEAIQPGRSRVVATDESWATFVRVARAGYVGRCIFRHLEEPDE